MTRSGTLLPSVLLVLAAALAAPGPPSAAAQDAGAVHVERLSGEPIAARRLTALDARRLVVDAESGPVEVPLDDVVEVSFPTPADAGRAPSSNDVAVDLWTGETVLGELRGGDGDHVDVETALLGRLRIDLERIAAVRFLQRLAAAAEPPDLRPRDDADVVHLTGGDRYVATLEGFSDRAVRTLTPQKDPVEVAYDKLVAVVLVQEERTAARPAGVLRVALRDGTRVAGEDPRLEGGRLRMRSPSGFAADCALADVVALQATGSRYAFLSDLPAKVEVKPLWEVAAGDPAVLFAPRFDRSFSGKPLRCGGRAWLDGIGVFSGTTLTWDLGGRYREFRTSVGLDDGAGPHGGVVFRVLVDGKEAWTSGFVRSATAPGRGRAGPIASPRIPLDGARTLSLVVLAGDDDDPYPVQDEADWLGALVVATDGAAAPQPSEK